MPSFDIACEVDLQEMDNVINQSSREISTRFDFKSGKSSLELDRQAKTIKVIADDELKLRAIHQILETKIARRGIDIRFIDYQEPESASGNLLKQTILLKNGIEKEDAKKISKLIKDSKLKVQSQIQDDQVRVTGKKIDDLQEVISLLKKSDLGMPLQFINMRS